MEYGTIRVPRDKKIARVEIPCKNFKRCRNIVVRAFHWPAGYVACGPCQAEYHREYSRRHYQLQRSVA